MAFRGTFEYTLDAKNRLTVPAKFRSVLSDGVVLSKGLDGCVAIWTPAAYEAQAESGVAQAGLNPLSPDARQLRRFFAANAFDTELDAAGRVMIPQPLIEHAGLRKEVVVTGAADCLEVWDRATWAEYNEKLSAAVPEIAASLGQPA